MPSPRGGFGVGGGQGGGERFAPPILKPPPTAPYLLIANTPLLGGFDIGGKGGLHIGGSIEKVLNQSNRPQVPEGLPVKSKVAEQEQESPAWQGGFWGVEP